MKYDKITFENIGPIEKGQIKRHKVNVFFGPNNSGKSIASRLIHGIGQLNTSSTSFQRMIEQKIDSKKEMNVFFGYSVLNSAGLSRKDLLTYNKKSCNLIIHSSRKSSTIDFGFKKSTRVSKNAFMLHHYASIFPQTSKDSVYIPAGRTGTIQFFTSITQVRNRLLRDLLGSFRSDDPSSMKKTSAKEIKSFTRSLSKLPEHLEQFHDLILDAHAEGMNKNVQDLFSNLFQGSIESMSVRGLPEIIYRDPTGFITEIESAGSGTVSSFPIVAGVHYVKKGGTLIIEEPEAHLEPARQLKLIEELVKIAEIKKIDLIFTTHSDYVIKKLLALISRKKIKHSDLGLYYFNRTPKSLTQIEQIPVDKTGEAEQTLFEDALNTLVGEFSE